MRTIILSLALAIGFTLPNQASASECGSVSGSNSSETIVVGRTVVYFSGLPVYSDELWVCIDNGGTRTAYSTTCDTHAGGANWLTVNGSGGDDTIAIHTGGVIVCGAVSLAPWVSSGGTAFTTAVSFNGGGGSDTLYGSPNNDQLRSNNTSFTDDAAQDVMCGYGGNDTLYGDGGDSTDMECMNGGVGTDTGNGYGSDVSPDPDRYENGQETFSSASWAPAPSPPLYPGHWCSSICGVSPPVVL